MSFVNSFSPCLGRDKTVFWAETKATISEVSYKFWKFNFNQGASQNSCNHNHCIIILLLSCKKERLKCEHFSILTTQKALTLLQALHHYFALNLQEEAIIMWTIKRLLGELKERIHPGHHKKRHWFHYHGEHRNLWWILALIHVTAEHSELQ